MRYLVLTTLVVSLFIPDVAFGQKGRGGGGRGGGGGRPSNSNWSGGGSNNWHGGNWNGGNWNGGHGGHYDHNNNWVPYAAFGLGYALGGWGWNGYGAWPGYYNSPSYYSDSYTNYDSYPRQSSYYDPTASGSSVSPNRVQLEIIVPDPNAQLLIQGQPMTIMGTRRLFVSPDLEQGKTYTYKVTLKRNVNGRSEDDTREIDVQAGTMRWIDFSQPQMQTMPTPGQSGEKIPSERRTSPPPAEPPK